MRLKRQAESVNDRFAEFVKHREAGKSLYAVERLAQLVIQSILDFAAMVSVRMGLRKPETYRGLAALLAEELGLGRDLRRSLEQMAGFRNILVHGYARIDPELEERAFEEMEQRLPAVIEALEKYVEGSGSDPPKTSVREGLAEVFKRHRVRFAFLFGSRARSGAGRDYDIAVSVSLRSALELGGLLIDAAEALGVGEEEVDMVHLDAAPPGMIYTVLSEGVLIYGDQEEAYNFLYQRYLELLDVGTLYQLCKKRGTSAQGLRRA